MRAALRDWPRPQPSPVPGCRHVQLALGLLRSSKLFPCHFLSIMVEQNKPSGYTWVLDVSVETSCNALSALSACACCIGDQDHDR